MANTEDKKTNVTQPIQGGAHNSGRSNYLQRSCRTAQKRTANTAGNTMV
jgi:hypothetical protein